MVFHEGYWVARDDREDLVQEVLVQVHRAVTTPEFRVTMSGEALIRTIAHRRCVDWLRRQRPLDDDPPEPVVDGPSPEEAVLANEQVAQVRTAFATLGYACRRMIGLRVVDGLSCRKIAERMRSTEGSIRVRMHRCLKRLRSLVDATGHGDPPGKEG